jgi:probable selenium-dependent hydroxylase accessory protein YqeC
MTLIDYLDISTGSVVAVVGCGGKTSLISLLAGKLRNRKVLVSTTTKIYPPKMEGVLLCVTLRQCEEHEPQKGVQYMGLLNNASGKLEAPPESLLAELVLRYDIVLLEADGSRGLPCKGWLENEPAVPRYCTCTMGVVTMNALGKAADATTVHRLPEFLALTGLGEGETITAQALEAMVCAPKGMFKNSAGRRYIIVNQAEDDAVAGAALSFLKIIKEKYLDHFTKLLLGSVHHDVWQEV